MNHPQPSERGQAMVLIVLAIIVIFAFSALAIDGGMLYSERGRAQNAADSAAMAAAMAGATGGNSGTSAMSMAATNGFNNDVTNNTVILHHPPIDGPYANVADKNNYYQVKITVTVSPIFSQFVRKGPMLTSVEAVSKYQPSTAITGNNAIVTLDNTPGEAGLEFNGDVKLYVYNGNIWSNNDANKTGKANGCSHGECPGIYIHSSPTQDSISDPCSLSACDGVIYTVGTWGANKDKVIGSFQPNQPVMLVPDIPQPYCPPGTGATRQKVTLTYGSETPVDYYVETGSNIPTHPEPGIHCVHGSITKDIDATSVLLVMLDGGVSKNNFKVRAAAKMIDNNGNDWGRMAIYAPAANHSAFDFQGNNESLFIGTVFVPGMTCDFGGTPNNEANDTAMVCFNFRMHGNPYINITFNQNNQYHPVPWLALMQ